MQSVPSEVPELPRLWKRECGRIQEVSFIACLQERINTGHHGRPPITSEGAAVRIVDDRGRRHHAVRDDWRLHELIRAVDLINDVGAGDCNVYWQSRARIIDATDFPSANECVSQL